MKRPHTVNTRKTQILVAVFLAISIMTSTAQAGLFNWFTSNKASADEASSGSFDQLYTSMSTPDQNDSLSILDSGNAMIATSMPSKNTSVLTHRMYTVQVSGYNSEVGQTDDSPFITASNTHVRDGIVASNMFPFGTVIKIPSLYGDKIFVVEDRMNKRYQNNVDIWFADHTEALKLGRRTIQIEVIK